MDLRQRNRRFSASVVALTVVGMPLGALFISQVTRAAGGTVGSGDCQASVSQTSTVTATSVNGTCIYTFTNGVNSFAPPTGAKKINFLVVGGGGGGGSNRGGGGGAGGFYESSWTYTSGSVDVVVGGGGAGGATPTSNIGVQGTDGGTSSITGGGASVAAGGGGGGGAHGVGTSTQVGRNGVALANGYTGPSGSGGGASMNHSNAGFAGGTATAGSGYANAGAASPNDLEPNRNTGGGGGAGGAGVSGSGGACDASTGVTPAGGAGRSSSIGGSSVTYAAGGGGADARGATEACAGPDTPRLTSGRGLGGSGIGGNGAALGGAATSASANTGSGGGAGNSDSSVGGDGGSGVVILSVDATKPVSSGTTTTDYLPKATNTVSVAYSATDTAALSSVSVFYSVASDLSSPTQCGSATGLSGTSASGNITCTLPSAPTTTKTYYLYTVATDSSGLVEDIPGSSDDSFIHDAITPLSTANIVRVASNTAVIPVEFTATDSVGLDNVKAYVTINSNLLGGTLCGTTSVTGTSASGTVSCTVASPSNGTTYYFYTVATDLAGQVEASADYTPGDSARYDTTKPSVSSGPAFGARVKSSGAISATPSEAGTLYFVSNSVTVTNEASLTSLNDNQYNSVSVGSAYAATDVYATGLSEGSYKLYIVDEAGNVSNVYAYQVVVDDTAPTKPTGLGVYSWDDTGTSNSDGITKITTPNLVANTSEGNGQVTFTAVKGASTVTCTDIVIASGSTGTTYCGTSTYSSGTWTVTAVHTDAAGNVSPTSDAFTMVIDTTAPARPSDADLVDAYDYGNSSTDNITSASYAYYKTTSPSGESNGMVELKMKSGSTYVSTCTYYDTDTLKQCQLEPNANDGTFQVEAWYYDQAGNGTISMLAIGFTYDRTAPVLTTSMSGTIGLTQTVSGSSNSTGRLWLVDGYANSSSWPDFTGLLDNQQNFSSYLTANTSATVAATGLADGWYYMYATDVAGNISARSTNSVTVDATLPTVTQITATNGRYKAATNVDISVSFSENVVVTPTPRILLNIGTNQYANYLSGSGTNTLIFRYVVPSSVNSSDLEYASTTALASGTIKDAYENSAVLTLPATGSANSLAGTSDVIIDTTAPTASFTNPSSAYSNATSVTYTFTFSEQVSAPTAANFSNTGTSTGCSYSISTSNNLSYTVVISGCTDGTIIPRLAANAVNDLAGNAGPGSAVTAGTTNFDHVAPTITACTCAKASGAAGTFTSVTLNSNGTVYLVKSTVTVNSLSDITSAADNEWNSNSVVASTSMGVYATGLVEGTYKLYATDLAGNFSVMYAGGSLIVDNVAPTFTVVGGTYGNGKTISSTSSEVGTVWYILQSVSVPSPVTADFLLNSPAVSNKRVVTNIVSANTPTLSQSIVQTSQFPSGIYDAYAVDEAGNVSTVLSSAVTLDTTAPTLTSISSSSPNGTYLYGQTINIDVTFSKPMKANSTVNLILETGTSDRTVNYSSGTGTNVLTFVYTVQSGDTSSDLELVSSATLYSAGNLSDIYGNTSAQGCCNNFAAPIGAATSGSLSNAKDIVVDGVVPVVSSNVNSANGNQSSYYTTVTFSGDVTDFDLSDITRGGSATGCTTGLSATSASVYVISYTGCSDGTISSSIRVDAVTFASGNRGPKSANLSATLTKDTAAPIVTQSPAATYFTATVAMSYSVNETSTVYLVNTNVSVTNVASITSAASNQWKSASYVSGTSSINGANLADGTYKFYAVDPYGNLSNASTATYTLDTVAPTASMNTGMVIIGGSATVRSNETGTLYLVKSTVTVTTISSILSSGSTNYKSQAVSSANTDQSVAVSGLVDGTYYAYASDGAGNLSAVSTNSISVDNTAPTVTNVTANSSAGNYIIGQTVLIDVLFNDIVNVDTTNGTPTLLLETGTTDRNATYVSGSGTNTLRFSYTVQAGDTTADLNYQSTTALANGGGTIKDNNENNATLTLPSTAGASSLASRSAIFVKGTRISVVGSSVPTSPTTSSTLSFGLSFSEAAYGLTTSDFTFGGTATGCTVSSVGTPTSSASITVTGCSDGTVILKLPALSMLDFYNNAGPAAEYSTTSITVDRTGPVPTFTIPTTPTTATSLTYTVTFNELMNSLAATDFQVTGTATGCSVAISAAAGTTVTVTLTSCSAGTVILSLKAGMVNDSLSNTGPATLTSAATVTRDLTAPTVSSFAPDVTPTNAAAPTFALTFSEEITGLSASDFTVAGTATACTVVPGSATGTVISISVTGCSGGTVILTLKSAMVADIAGNSGPASAANSSTLTIDRIAPSAAASPVLASSSDVGVSASDSKTNLTTVTISATTPEANGSIVFTATLNGTSLTCSSTVTSSSGSCVITGLTEGSWAVTAVFTDAAGNAGPTSSITTLVIDTTAPTVSITAPSSPIRSLPATFTVTFSESISGLAASDFTNNGGSSTGCTFTPASSSGTTINVSIDMCSDGTFALQLAANAVTDVSGNAGPAANEVTSLLTIDNGPPVATVTAATLQNTQNATVRANKVGTVYLVKSTVSVAAEADITSAANNAWNSVSISTIDTDTSLALTGLSDGTYKAYAVDGQSRVSVASTASVVVDTTSPTAPVSIAVDSSSDTGSSSSDGLTKDNTPTIRVVASENGGTITVTATRAFQTDVVCTVAGSTTGSTCDLGTLVDGTWTLTAVHTDAALNVSSSVTGSASIDTVAPTVSGVSTNTANGSKKSGVAIDIRVAFDGTVGVNTSSGSPTVTMETGSTDRAASFTSGSNSSVLVFTYTVQSSDTSSDLDYVATNSLALNGAVIADDAGNNATLTLASPGAVGSLANGASIVIDTTAPLAPTSVAIATASDSGSSSSDGITNDNTPTISVVAAENGATVTVTASKTGQADVVCTVSGSTTGSTCDLATLADGVWTLTAVQSDSATNMSSSVTSSVTIDTASPSAPISVVLATASDSGPSSNDGLTNDNTPTISVATAENGGSATVTASRALQSDVTCTLSGSTSGSTCDLTTLVDGSWTMTAVQTDVAGNVSSSVSGSFIIDTVAPSATSISSNTTNGAKKAGTAIDVRVTFDGAVGVNSTSGSPTLLMETGSTDHTASFTSGSNSSVLVFTYTVQSGDTSSDLDYVATNSLALNGAVVADDAGNSAVLTLPSPGASGSLAANKAIVIDTSAPTAPVLTTATITTTGNAVVRSAETGTVYLVKTSVNVGSLADITSANGALWNQVSIASANTDTNLAATGLADGDYRAYAVDAAENVSASSIGVVTIDTSVPTITIAASPTSVSSGGTSSLTFTLSESLTGFDATDVSAGLGTIGSFSGSGTQYTATFTASAVAGGAAKITVAANAIVDAAGNSSAESTANITVASPTGTNGRQAAVDNNTNYIIEQFTTAGTYTFHVPKNVTSLEYIVIGGGGGGGGGGYVAGANGGGGGGGGAGSLRMGTLSVLPDTNVGVRVGPGGAGGVGGRPNSLGLERGAGGEDGTQSGLGSARANGGYGGCASALNASVSSCGYLLLTDGYGGFGGSNAEANGGNRASILGGGGGGGAGSYGVGGDTSTSAGGIGGGGTPATFYGISDTFGTGGNGGPGAAGALAGTAGAKRGNGGNGGGGGLNGSNGGAGGNGSDGFVAVRYALPTVTQPDLTDASDTGDSSTDNLTKLTTPTFTGTAPVGATVQLYVDSVASGSTCTASSDTGDFSCTTGVLSHGSHSITAKSSILLAGGVAESTSTALTINVDTVNPVATLTSATLQWGYNGSGQSNEVGVVYLVKTTETVTDEASILALADNVWNYANIGYVNTNATISTLGLTSGTYKLYALDAAGNLGLASSSSITYFDDTTAPTPSLTTGKYRSVDSATISSTEMGTMYLVKSTITVNSVSDITNALSTARKSASVNAANVAQSLSLSGLSEGTYYLYAIDGAGNLSSASTSSIVIDNTSPTVSSFTSASSSYVVRTFDLTLTMSESVTGLSSSDFSNTGTASSCTFTPDASSGTTFTVTATCTSDGTVVARLSSNAVTDLAGNTGPASQASAASVTLGATPSKLVITTNSSGTASGAAFTTQPVVSLANAQDLIVTSYAATVTASITQVNGTGSLEGIITAAVDTSTGRATFSDLGITGTAGTAYTITYSSGSLTVATQTVTVSVGVAKKLEVTTQPVGGASGAAFSTQPVVRIVDSGSNPVIAATASVSVTTSTGTIGGTRPKVTVSGVATFTDLTFSGLASQNHVLTFSATGLTSATSSTFNVTAGAPTQLVLTTQSVGTESGAAFTTQPVLEVRDSGGNKVTASSALVTANVSSGAVLEGTTSATASLGVATYSNLGISGTAGTSYTITYSSTGLSSAVQAVTPTVGPATKLQVSTQPVGAGAGAALATQPIVQVVDSGGNVIVGSNASIAVTASGGTLGGTTTKAASSGVATFTNLTFAGTAGTNYRLEFTSFGLTSATSSDFTVSVGAPTHLSITTQPIGAGAGALLATQPVVNVLDAGDNVVTASSAAIVVTASGGTLGGTTTVSASNGVATYSTLTFAGTISTNYALTFSSSGLGTMQSNNFTVTVGADYQLAINTSAAGAKYKTAFTTQPIIEVQDAGGNRTGSSSTITATISSGTLLSNSGTTKTATASNGHATFSGLGIIGTPGSYTVTYSSGSLQTASQSITLNKADQSINTASVADRVFSTTAFAMSSSPDSGLTVSYVSTTTAVCTVSNADVTMVGIGTCSITASQSGNVNYNAATNEIVTFAISRATPTVTFGSLTNKTYGDSSFTVQVDADMPVAVSFAGTSGVCSVGSTILSGNRSSATVSIIGAGSCSVTASRAQDATYFAATAASGSALTRTFSIAKAAGSIAFDPTTLTQTYNSNGRVITATVNSGTVTITYTGIAPTVYAPSTNPPVNAGSYAVVAVQNAANYDATAAEILTVNKAQGAVVIDANSLAQTYSGTSRSVLVSSTTPSGLATKLTYSGVNGTTYVPSQYAPTDAGTYNVNAVLDDMNYEAIATGTLTVGLGVQSTVTLINRSSTTFGTSVTLSAVGGTGTGPLTYATTSGPCTVDSQSGLMTPTGAGACVVTATRGASGNFGATSSSPFTVTINQAPQTVEFTSVVPTRPLPGNTYTPTATASSGLAPTIAITQGSGTVCTLSGGVVTIVASGTCEVTASQQGDANWLAASPVVQTMVAGRLNQSITFASIPTKTFGDPVFSLGATASSGRIVEYAVLSGSTSCAVDTGGVVTLAAIGSCVIEASQPGDTVYSPAATIRRTIIVEPTTPSAPFLASVSASDGSVTVAYNAPSSDGGLPVQAYSVEVRFAGSDRSFDVTKTDCTASLTCYIDGLTNGRSYNVTVAAVNAIGVGARSASSPLILPILNPQAVRGLTARAGNQIINVEWSAPSNLGGGTFVRYEVSIRNRSGSYQSPISISNYNTTSYQFTGLDNGTSYDVKIVTITSSGATEFTGNTAEVFEMPRTVASVPRDLTIAAPTGRVARVSWRIPQSDGGSAITSYVVNAQGNVCVFATPSDVVCEIAGLTPGSPLTIDVRAVNGVGQSQAATVSMNLPNRPTAPIMRSVVVNASTALASWLPPTSDGGQPVLGYLVYISETGSRVSTAQLSANDPQCSTLETSCQIEGLDPTKTYAFVVRAINAVGQSDASAPLDPFVKPKTASAPTKTPTTVKKPTVLPAGVATVTLGVNVNMVPTSQMIKIQGTNLKAGSTTSVKLVVDIGSQRVQKELATRTVGSTGTLSLYAMLNNSLPTGSYKIFVAAIGANGRTVSAEASFLIPQTWNSIAGSLPLLPPASQSSTNKPTTTVPKSTVITIPSTPVSGAGQTTTTISPSGESVPTTQAPTSSSVVTTTSTPTGPGTTVVTTETKNTGGPTITLQLVVVVFTSGFAFAILLILLALLRRRRRDNVSK